jgi:OOP family OmpA-OmpF porin
MRTSFAKIAVIVGALALIAGCGAIYPMTKGDADRTAAVMGKIGEAERMGAMECAPQELARAQVMLEKARHEAMEIHDAKLVDADLKVAEKAADDLLAKTRPCWEAKQKKPAPPPPPPPAPKDSDGDGVTDDLDKCPDTPKGVKVDAVGCPLDSDGDGVPDYLDKCPDTPKGVKVDAVGCPLDSDGDGVPDYMDKCPGTAKGVKVDATGCPPKVETVELRINFDFDKADVKPQYMPQIEKVAAFLKAHPDYGAIIEGHTDSKGTEEYNLKLSARRANAVAKILNEKYGIAMERMTAQSLGESKPIASNATEEGRAQNRRIYAYMEKE